ESPLDLSALEALGLASSAAESAQRQGRVQGLLEDIAARHNGDMQTLLIFDRLFREDSEGCFGFLTDVTVAGMRVPNPKKAFLGRSLAAPGGLRFGLVGAHFPITQLADILDCKDPGRTETLGAKGAMPGKGMRVYGSVRTAFFFDPAWSILLTWWPALVLRRSAARVLAFPLRIVLSSSWRLDPQSLEERGKEVRRQLRRVELELLDTTRRDSSLGPASRAEVTIVHDILQLVLRPTVTGGLDAMADGAAKRPRTESVPWAPRKGCPVGALLCDAPQLPKLFALLGPLRFARPKGVRDHQGKKAVHLTIEGATAFCWGQVPEALAKFLEEAEIQFLPGLRLGAQPYRGSSTPKSEAALPAAAFRFVELFAGVGGFRRALAPLGGRCVFAAELDVDCQEAYAANFGSSELYGDLTCVEDFPRHELLTAGFPCQPFARRGQRLGFEDARGELFFEILRALHQRQPRAFLLENVWNMQFLDGGCWDPVPERCTFGAVYKKVVASLEEAGYEVRSKQINSEGWVPQRRDRVYLVGFRDASAAQRFQWPAPPKHANRCVQDVLEDSGSDSPRRCELTETQWAQVQKSSTWLSGGQELRFAQLQGKARTLTASYKASYACTAELVAPSAGGRPRFFTRREAARLMGFPEEHVFANRRLAKLAEAFAWLAHFLSS
ncbi:unnamed protein product, partial [Effrenium voratum]